MKELFEQILHALERGENVVLCSILASSGSAPRGAGAKMAVFLDGTALGTIGGGAVERIAQQQALELFRTGASYCQAFCLAPNQVNDIGMICGGTVMVYFRFFDHCSPQDAALVRAILELLQSGQDEVHITPRDYVVIMTPGHQADREVLLQAMKTPACYVGCIGSRHKIASTNQYLMDNGVEEAELSRIHAPIGITIFAETPEEIAISIAAELIRCRAQLAGTEKARKG